MLGLRLAEWQPEEEAVPDEILALVQQRQQARGKTLAGGRRAARSSHAAGYEIEDTPQGPKVKSKRVTPGTSQG